MTFVVTMFKGLNLNKMRKTLCNCVLTRKIVTVSYTVAGINSLNFSVKLYTNLCIFHDSLIILFVVFWVGAVLAIRVT